MKMAWIFGHLITVQNLKKKELRVLCFTITIAPWHVSAGGSGKKAAKTARSASELWLWSNKDNMWREIQIGKKF